MTDLDHARAMVARCEAKRDKAGNELSRYYYEMCRRAWLVKLERGL